MTVSTDGVETGIGVVVGLGSVGFSPRYNLVKGGTDFLMKKSSQSGAFATHVLDNSTFISVEDSL